MTLIISFSTLPSQPQRKHTIEVKSLSLLCQLSLNTSPSPSLLTSFQPLVILCQCTQIHFWTHTIQQTPSPWTPSLHPASCCDDVIGNVLQRMAAFRRPGFKSWLHLFFTVFGQVSYPSGPQFPHRPHEDKRRAHLPGLSGDKLSKCL